jgi:hypothetical protein
MLEYLYLIVSISALAGIIVDRFLYRDIKIFVASLIVATVGIFNYGMQVKDNQYKEKIERLESKVKEAEEKSKEVNEKIVIQYVTKEKIITAKAKEVTKYIDREVVKYDSECKVPEEVIFILNEASKEPGAIN